MQSSHLAVLLLVCCVLSAQGLEFLRKPTKAGGKHKMKHPLTRPTVTAEGRKAVSAFLRNKTASGWEKSFQQKVLAGGLDLHVFGGHRGGDGPVGGSSVGSGNRGDSVTTGNAVRDCATTTNAPSPKAVAKMMFEDAVKEDEDGCGAHPDTCECVIGHLTHMCYPEDCVDCAKAGFDATQFECDYEGAPRGPGYCECENDFMSCIHMYEEPFDPAACEDAKKDSTLTEEDKGYACMSPVDYEAYCCQNRSDPECGGGADGGM